MSIYDNFYTRNIFKKDETGRTVYVPLGLTYNKQYIITDQQQTHRLKRIWTYYYVFSLLEMFLIAFNMEHLQDRAWLSALILSISNIGFLYLIIRSSIDNLPYEVTTFDKRLSFYSKKELYQLMAISVLTLIVFSMFSHRYLLDKTQLLPYIFAVILIAMFCVNIVYYMYCLHVKK